MTLSSVEGITVLRAIDKNLSRLQLSVFLRSEGIDNNVTELDKPLCQLLDALAFLLAAAASQVCAVSIALLPRRAILTVGFNDKPVRDVKQLPMFIWKWMQSRQGETEKDENKYKDLAEVILQAFLYKIRQRLSNGSKGYWVEPLALEAKTSPDFTPEQKNFVFIVYSMHKVIDVLLGEDVRPDYKKAMGAYQSWRKKYNDAKMKFNDFTWLGKLEKKFPKNRRAAGFKARGEPRKPGATGKPKATDEPTTTAATVDILRHVEKFFKPYTQFVLISKAVKEPKMQGALDSTLDIAWLEPSPLRHPAIEYTPAFRRKVQLYLTGMLHTERNPGPDSDSDPELETSVIDQLVEQVDEGMKRENASAVNIIHCECALVRHHLSNGPPFPYHYIGVSKLSCFQCSLYFEACKRLEYRPGLSFQTRGSHSSVEPCTLPINARGRDEQDNAIEKTMEDKLREIFEHVVKEELRRRQRTHSQSTVDSEGSPFEVFTEEDTEVLVP